MSKSAYQLSMELDDFCCHGFIVKLVPMHDLGEFALELLHVGLFFELFLLDLLQQFLDGLFQVFGKHTFGLGNVDLLGSLIPLLPGVRKRHHHGPLQSASQAGSQSPQRKHRYISNQYISPDNFAPIANIANTSIDIQNYYSLMQLIPNYRLLDPLRSALTALQATRNASHTELTRGELTQPINQLCQVYQQLEDLICTSSQFYKKIEEEWKCLVALKPTDPNLLVSSQEDADQVNWLQHFIQTSIARSKLSRLGLISSRQDIECSLPEVVRFPELAKEIEQRHQSYIEIIKIQKIVSAIEQLYSHNNIRQQASLKAISNRLQALLHSINQSQHHFKNKSNSVPLSQHLKDHQLTLQLVRLITEANDGLLQQLLQNVQNHELHRIIVKAVSQILQRNEQLSIIYHHLLKNSAVERVQLLCRFPRAVREHNFDRKLKECVKLLQLGSKERQQSLNQRVPHQSSPQQNLSNAKILNNPEPSSLVELECSYNIRLLSQQQQIYTLQQQNSALVEKLQLAKSTISSLQQQMLALNHELAEAYTTSTRQSVLYEQSKSASQQQMHEYQQQINSSLNRYLKLQDQHISKLEQKNNQIKGLINQLQRTEHNCHQLQQEKQALIKQFDALQQQNQSIKYLNDSFRRNILQLQYQIGTMQQQVETKRFSLSVASKQAQTDQRIQRHPSLEIHNNLHSITLGHSNQIFQTSVDFLEGLSRLEIEAITPQQPSSQELHAGRQRGFLSMKHSKSLSQAFNPQFMQQTLDKQEQYDNPGLQLKRMLSAKEKAIKRYQFHLQKYRSQNVKYQATILQLQSKIRKYQLELIQLNELLKSFKLDQQLEKLQEDSHLVDGYEEKDDSNHSSIDNLIEKEITLKLKEESLNFKIEEIIKHVMHLNQFKTETAMNSTNTILSTSITALSETQFNQKQ